MRLFELSDNNLKQSLDSNKSAQDLVKIKDAWAPTRKPKGTPHSFMHPETEAS